MSEIEIMWEGRYLRLLNDDGWEYASRKTRDGAVVIVPVTDAGKVIFVEQFRPPVGASCIEFPAGLVGDCVEFEGESLEVAAERELLEETGYAAEQMEPLTHGPPSPGLSDETVTFFRATGLRKVSEGGGDSSESIVVHEIDISDVFDFVAKCEREGKSIDPKIYVGLFFVGVRPSTRAREVTIDIPGIDGPRRSTSPTGMKLEDELLETLDSMIPELPGEGRVGILGGSFNPPHVGHSLLAHAMLATEGLDALWVIPVGEHPFGKDSVGFEHRLAMCRTAFSRLSQVSVLEIERALPTPSYTVQTLSALHAVRPGIEPTLIIGSDIIPELPRWQEPERLPALSKITVVPRQGAPEIEEPSNLDFKVYRGFRLPRVSSTAIKAALRNKERVDGLLDLDVLDYIRTHGLYAS